MLDPDVREALVTRLQTTLSKSSHRVVHEMNVRWHTPARLDVVAISDRIVGFEIKSEADSLARFERQSKAYGDVVERAYLVASERHIARATMVLPAWWGIWSARRGGRGEVRLAERRPSRLNPEINPLAVLTLVTSDELRRALVALGKPGLSSWGADRLRSHALEELGSKRTVTLVRGILISREGPG